MEKCLNVRCFIWFLYRLQLSTLLMCPNPNVLCFLDFCNLPFVHKGTDSVDWSFMKSYGLGCQWDKNSGKKTSAMFLKHPGYDANTNEHKTWMEDIKMEIIWGAGGSWGKDPNAGSIWHRAKYWCRETLTRESETRAENQERGPTGISRLPNKTWSNDQIL